MTDSSTRLPLFTIDPHDPSNEIPYGYCLCGCGQKTTIASRNRIGRGQVKGQPIKYIPGHGTRKHPHAVPLNPSGLCQCGCGQTVPVPRFPFQQRRFINGHQHMTHPPTERFWKYVNKSGGTDSCWLWTGGKQPGGYGLFYTGEKLDGAHRFSYELHKGQIPHEMHVLHTCDNPPCVNPAHLWLGSPADNMQDCSRKGRAKSGIHLGERNTNAKLTEDSVREIRQRYASGEIGPDLAREYGVSHQVIYGVIHRKIWKHVI